MRRALAAMGWTAATLAGGCEVPRTEVVVRVDSEVSWGAGREIQSLVITVRRGGAAGPLRSARTTVLGVEPGRLSLPLSVGVIAADDDETPVWIEALGCADPNGCAPMAARVAQRAVVRFTRGQTQELPLLLASACLGVQCRSDERCAPGTGVCEPATRAQETLRPIGDADAAPGDVAPATDRGAVLDAVADAVVDAVVDVVAPVDRAVSTDRGATSDGSADAGPRDVLPTDTGPMDAGRIDAGPMDAGRVDTGPMDTGRIDTGPMDTGPPDTGPQCSAPFVSCVGVCVNVQSSNAHCGGCGRACAGGRACVDGVCVGGPAYTVDTAAVITSVDACAAPGSTRILESVDDAAEAVPLPFTTLWWGATLPTGTPMAVASNGVVHVNGADGPFVRFQAIPSAAAPNGLISAQWRDLYTSPDGVCVATVGAAPSRRWVAQWIDTGVLGVTSSLNFEVIVHEGTGVIDLVYDTMSGAGDGSVGLENPTGTQAVGGCGATLCTVRSNARIRFTPGG
ncbi:MAG: hypothetical protein Q7V43_05090 [Myxococcales bacterium]|nr:hypothetical protein [Myxococcales bacterium]